MSQANDVVLLKASTPEEALKVYQTLNTDITYYIAADAAEAVRPLHDLGAWLGLDDGSSPGVFILATSLDVRRTSFQDVRSRNWTVTKFQFFWYEFINGQRVTGKSDLAEAGEGYYYQEVGIKFHPRRSLGNGLGDDMLVTSIAKRIRLTSFPPQRAGIPTTLRSSFASETDLGR